MGVFRGEGGQEKGTGSNRAPVLLAVARRVVGYAGVNLVQVDAMSLGLEETMAKALRWAENSKEFSHEQLQEFVSVITTLLGVAVPNSSINGGENLDSGAFGVRTLHTCCLLLTTDFASVH
eukprot:757403-Hanusia_phi.AAC.5